MKSIREELQGARFTVLCREQSHAVNVAFMAAFTETEQLSTRFYFAPSSPFLFEPDWQAAEADLQPLLASCGLGDFLAVFFGELPGHLVVYPNLLYPGHQTVVGSGDGELALSQPPPPAWGASTPWRYGERPDEVLASLAEGFARGLLVTGLPGQVLGPGAAAGLPLAAAVLFLREAEGAAAADQFMLVEQRLRGLPRLAAMVSALAGRHGLAELAEALSGLES